LADLMEEAFLALIGLTVALWVMVSPVVSIVNLVRVRRLRASVDELQYTVRSLEARLDGVARAQARQRTEAPAAPAAAPSTVVAAPPAAAPSVPPIVEVKVVVAPPATEAPVTPSAPAPTPAPGAPPSGAIAAPPPPPGPPAVPPPLPAAAERPRHAAWPPPPPGQARAEGAPPAAPPRPPIRPPAEPPPPAEPEAAFDWESLLGIRGAAWLAGITLVIAALLFAKWSIDQGFFSPLVRVILMVVAGTAALVWAEIGLRKGYQPTADALSGAGIVILYAAWFSARSLYGLIGVTPAFVAMSAVTLVAAVISVRRAALFTAILGVLGGLATPLLLSSGQDRPIGLFSYLALLNLGFLFVARRQRWAVITALALCGTSLLEFGWMALRLREETLLVGIVSFAVLGGLYLWHALATEADDQPTNHGLGVAGATIPLLFSVIVAANPRFSGSWPLVLGNVALLGVAVIATCVTRIRALVVTSAVTTALACAVWPVNLSSRLSDLANTRFPPGGGVEFTTTYVSGHPWAVGPALVVIALVVLYNVIARLFRGTTGDAERPVLSSLGVSGLVVAGGLFLFTVAVLPMTHPPAWLLLTIFAVLFLVLVERTTVDVAPLVLPAGAALLGVLAREWFEVSAVAGVYVALLAFGHLIAVAFAIAAVVRDRRGDEADASWWTRSDVAVLTAVAVAYLGLHAAIDRVAYADPGPIFALLGLDVALVLFVAIRRDWTVLVPLAAIAAWFATTNWHVQRFTPEVALVAVAAEIAIYLTFVVLPFVLTATKPRPWRTSIATWLTSAMIGPAFFVIFRAAWVEAWGTGTIGLLAVILAAVSVASLAGVGRVFAADPSNPEEAARRLNYLALFAAIALGFVAAAIAMQLDRQWWTIGWALEAAAVFWVFGLVPHPGLKYFGLLLFAAVGVRLLANPEVFRYEPRGAPILNWLLYTYGVPVLCTFVGGWFLRRSEARRGDEPEYDWTMGDRTLIVPVVGALGLVLLFWLINLQIFDFFSAGRYLEIDLSRRLERDLTLSAAWGLYALGLLALGLWRANKGLRVASLVFLFLTVAKVFLYDLSALTGLYRILSFVGLGVSLIIFSLLYQRFARKATPA
jgi:uncharacterized membrane protein